MIKNIRRKIANAIRPKNSHSYRFAELKLATPQCENRRSLERAHINFEKEFGRPAADHAEAWKWDREQLNISLKELGLEPVRTEFVPSHFFEEENTPNSKKNQG